MSHEENHHPHEDVESLSQLPTKEDAKEIKHQNNLDHRHDNEMNNIESHNTIDNDEDEDEDDDEEQDQKESKHNKKAECRMYENEFPEVDDIIVVEVITINDMGVYCKLLEYNNIEGIIRLSELQRQRIRSVKRIVKPGQTIYVAVVNVKKDQGHVDLSKKRVTPEDIAATEERWNKSKAVHSIMRHVASLSKYEMIDLYEIFGWKISKKYGSIYNGFKIAIQDWDNFIKQFNIPKEIIKSLKKSIAKRLRPSEVTVRAHIEVTCFSEYGINGIKKALYKGLEYNHQLLINNKLLSSQPQTSSTTSSISSSQKISIKLIAPPDYIVSINTLDAKQGIDIINHVIKEIELEIKKYGGALKISKSAEVITSKLE